MKVYEFISSPVRSWVHEKTKLEVEVKEFINSNNIYMSSFKEIDRGEYETPIGIRYWIKFSARGRTTDDDYRECVEYFIDNL